MAVDKESVMKFVWYFRVPLVVYLVPLLLFPMVVVPGTDNTPEVDCLYVLLVMGVLWCTEIVPLGVTALMPIFMFPLLGIMDVDSVCENYMEETTMLLMGGIMIAVAIEKSGLHKRFALHALSMIGTSRKWLMLGVMFPTWLLSMWISNTACTAMMMPIVEEVVRALEKVHRKDHHSPQRKENEDDPILDQDSQASYGSTDKTNLIPDKKSSELNDNIELQLSGEHDQPEESPADEKLRNLKLGLILSVPYAANAGGSGTLIGSTPQLILQGITNDLWNMHGESGPIDFVSWFVIGFPIACINFVIVWVWLQVLFVGPRELLSRTDDITLQENEKIQKTVDAEKVKLGEMKTDERLLCILFPILVIVWVFRDPGFDPAWAELFKEDYVSDAVPPILMAFMLFSIPATYTWKSKDPKADMLLTWQYIKELFPWDIVLLLGGSFALADGMEKSGLSQWLSDQLKELNDWPETLVLLIVGLFSTFFTEFCSNSAAASILIPIGGSMSVYMGKNPLYLMLGVTIAVQFAFMLPISTPPNAIAHSTGNVTVYQMAKAGFMLNFYCVFAMILAIETWCTPYFDLDEFPWDFPNSTAIDNL